VNVVYEARKAKNTLTLNVLREPITPGRAFGGQLFGMQYTYTRSDVAFLHVEFGG
jgi:hypothetical protein